MFSFSRQIADLINSDKGNPLKARMAFKDIPLLYLSQPPDYISKFMAPSHAGNPNPILLTHNFT